MRVNKSEAGFSFLEVMLVIGISAVLLIILGLSFGNSREMFHFNKEKLRVQHEHRVIVYQIAPFIRMSTSIDLAPANGDIVQFEFDVVETTNPRFNGIGFGINQNNQIYYRRRIETPTGFVWSNNRVPITDSQVTNFQVTTDPDEEIVTITVELQEEYRRAEGTRAVYTFEDTFYRRIQSP